MRGRRWAGLYHFEAKAFLMRGGDGRARPAGGRASQRRPALRAGRRLSTGPLPAFGGQRPHKIPPTRVQNALCTELVFEAKAFLT